jgi:hypothetical protein
VAEVIDFLYLVVGEGEDVESAVVVETLYCVDVVVVCLRAGVQRSSSRRLGKYSMH